MTPHEALKAAVEGRMRLAKEATPGPWEATRENEYMPWCLHEIERFREYRNHVFLGDDGPTAQHIAANDPAFVIRQCERDLKVLERHAPELAERTAPDDPVSCSGCTHQHPDLPWPCWTDWPCEEIRALAEVYQINLGVSDES